MRIAALVALGAGAAGVACGGRERDSLEARIAAERAESQQMRAQYEERIAALASELQQAVDARVRREEEWLRYTQAISKLSSAAEKPATSFVPISSSLPVVPEPRAADPAAAAVDPAAAPPPDAAGSPARDREVFLSLRALLDVEQVTGYDLLESGSVRDGATGPVVLRALDDHGRPVATIAAERLRLEASRAARSLTIVLEQGYERRGGEKTPFEGPVDAQGRGAERRIELPDVGPEAWIEALPELFAGQGPDEPMDDGRWALGEVRAALNLLLREDAASGWWRIVALGGVQGKVLRDVQIDGLDRDGRIERKLFADRMEVVPQERGVMIQLHAGAQVRGEEKTPFLEGRYRIFLPRADVEAWGKAGVPGMSEPREKTGVR